MPFGDFYQAFGLNQFLQSMREAQQQHQQAPFAPGQLDVQGGLFGAPAQAAAGSLHEPGLGGAGGAPGAHGGGGPGGADVAHPAPTASAVAQGPGPAAASPLAPGGRSPMAPGGAQVPQTKLEQGADEFMRAGDGRIPGMGGQEQQQRRFEDLMR
jgi:hypothetical protein